ncbi:MAG: hypothetical protein RLZZ505_2556 [Verrucomicrobiota bacterium]|jgi:hypothetical protein
MNPDYHDPKNYVPPTAPDDNWEDLDQVSGVPQIGLQPRRPDRGIPTKRELNSVSAKRHAPYPKVCDEDQVSSIEPISVGVNLPAKRASRTAKKLDNKPEKRAAKTVTKRSSKKKAHDGLGSIMDDTQDDVRDAESISGHASLGMAEADEKGAPLSITPERGSKRFRVNEISPQRPVEKRVRKTPLTLSKTTGKWSSNEALMQNGRIQSAEELSTNVTNIRATLVWIVCAGAFVISIVVGAILLSRPPKAESEVPKLTVFSDTDRSKEGSGTKIKTSLNTLINGENESKNIFARYARSKKVDDFIDIIYLPDKNRQIISNVWEPMGAGPGWKPGENSTWSVMENGGVQYGVLTGVLANFSGFHAVFRQDGDAMKMDWRATTGYSSAAYADLKQGLGDAAEIRAVLSPGDFYTFSLPEGEFRCYRLTAPDREENIWAYTKLNGKYDVKLASQFIPSQLTGQAPSEIAVLLALARGPAQSLPNQWIISKVVRLNWLDE